MAAHPGDRPALRLVCRTVNRGMKHIRPSRNEIIASLLQRALHDGRICVHVTCAPLFGPCPENQDMWRKTYTSLQYDVRRIHCYPQHHGRFTVKRRIDTQLQSTDRDVSLDGIMSVLNRPECTARRVSVYRIAPNSPNLNRANFVRTSTEGRAVYVKQFKY